MHRSGMRQKIITMIGASYLRCQACRVSALATVNACFLSCSVVRRNMVRCLAHSSALYRRIAFHGGHEETPFACCTATHISHQYIEWQVSFVALLQTIWMCSQFFKHKSSNTPTYFAAAIVWTESAVMQTWVDCLISPLAMMNSKCSYGKKSMN